MDVSARAVSVVPCSVSVNRFWSDMSTIPSPVTSYCSVNSSVTFPPAIMSATKSMSVCVTSRAGLPTKSATVWRSVPRVVTSAATSPISSVSAVSTPSISSVSVVSVSPIAANKSVFEVPNAVETSSMAFCNAVSRSSPASS